MSARQDSAGRLGYDAVAIFGRYRRQKVISLYEMLRQTGYPATRNSLDFEAVRVAVRLDPECPAECLAYSEDKRCSSGWFFRPNGRGGFEVGRLGVDGTVAQQRDYGDINEACARFILHELDEVAFGA